MTLHLWVFWLCYSKRKAKSSHVICRASVLNYYEHLVAPPNWSKIRKERQKYWIPFFENNIKYLSALGACHVTIIRGVVDKSSVSAMVNMRTRLNVPIATLIYLSSFSHNIPGVNIQNNCKREEIRDIHFETNFECTYSFIIVC